MQKQKSSGTQIAVIGGGAAGFFAAINAAETNPQNHITLYEGSNRPLGKVLISGGGRCNVTNYTLDPKLLVQKYPRGAKELLSPFYSFSVLDTIAWFKKRGVELKKEEDNRVFPVTDKSETIASCLKTEIRSRKINLQTGIKVISVEKKDNFTLTLSNGSKASFDKIVLATGSASKGYEMAGDLGHNIVKPVPSLFTFEIKSPLIENLAGVSFKNVGARLNVNKKLFKNEGPLLITHWGLSGPAVIVLSAVAARELFETNYVADLKLNFTPEMNSETLLDSLKKFKKENPKKSLYNNNLFSIPTSFWDRILELEVIPRSLTWAEVTKKELIKICRHLTESNLKINGKGKFKEEFVTAGGVKLSEVDFKTMESKICRGLFFAGEILDIDGVTGGFNFQAAWTTSYLAAKNL